MRLIALNELIAREITWLWPGRLALGHLAMLDGDPGLGKSLLTLDLCTRLTRGLPFPDGAAGPGVTNCILFCAEDSAENIILPRLQVMGADVSRIFIIQAEDTDLAVPLALPGHTAALEDALVRTRARLVVVDPVVAFLDPSVFDGNDRSIRRALFPLARLAESYDCAILLVRHLNKSGGLYALYRGSGSMAYLAVCRSAWLVGPDPDAPKERRVLAQLKNNLAPLQPSLAFSVCSEGGRSTQFTWQGPSAHSARQLLLPEGTAAGPIRPRDRAREFLLEQLHDGPRTSRELWEAAQNQSLSERTLYRARLALDIRVQKVELNDVTHHYWLLPTQKLPSELQPRSVESDEVDEWLARLRAQYPPSTPLDDL